ncbi:hypothetical protein TNCV_2562501 [Trichonephila clavipes]|uniref:Uncharacterized protein n=1 Tax=Trichonephila clavipes TaxID=2585209 RepID=A0A8X6R6T8_TRICX|nr:hypothetical protein TNCV_2562501 [Trichonephila clavipes]
MFSSIPMNSKGDLMSNLRHPFEAARRLLVTGLVILDLSQVTSMTPEPAPSLQITIGQWGGLEASTDCMCITSYMPDLQGMRRGCGSPVVKVSDHGRSSSPVPLKTRHVGARCTLNLSRTQTSSRGCGVVVRRGSASSSAVLVT